MENEEQTTNEHDAEMAQERFEEDKFADSIEETITEITKNHD